MRETIIRQHAVTVCIAAALTTTLAACGGGGGSDNANSNPPPAPNSLAYQKSVMLGSTAPVALSVIPATTTTSALLVSPVAAPLVAAGNNALDGLYQPATLPGAGVACVSAPTNSIGTVTNVNAGVNVKSVAALLDSTWTVSANATADWSAFGANAKSFDGWENCGAKAEGSPSPSSTLTINGDGSFSDNVFDGNPSTTVSIVNQSFSAAQATSMLSDAGLLDTSQAGNPQVIRLRVYRNTASQTVLIEQAIPVAGATNEKPGYVAIYFAR
ncbi:conserved exported hypothetical protein [Burkholderia sp. 8Y]|uniref:hypothetical protein n=1 Tax=Burkholderia sp. 8Y TaxID=2653133 RepID=UPI0012F2A852|nr:hypothetical protein [Burkholderia sp. 8Y]VXB36925.1 conserved exported hypothetical protein [Burkholderia sp. 8Y]